MPEDDELNEELSEGKELATCLVNHMMTMGAGGLEIPVLVQDEKYVVTVRYELVKPV